MVFDVSQLLDICRFVFPAQNKKFCQFMHTFPMIARLTGSCCFNAMGPIPLYPPTPTPSPLSKPCNLILDPIECTAQIP